MPLSEQTVHRVQNRMQAESSRMVGLNEVDMGIMGFGRTGAGPKNGAISKFILGSNMDSDTELT